MEEIVKKHRGSRGSLIAVLQDIQSKYNYLPAEALKELAEETGRSLVDIYGVATFYKSFSLTPKGRHILSVCLGTACHVRGAPGISEEFERQLKVKAGQTSSDNEFTLETVNCLGACALGPVVVVDGHYFSHVNRSRVSEIIGKARDGLDKVEIEGDERIFPIDVSCPRCNRSLMDPSRPVDGYPSIRVTVSFDTKHFSLSFSSLYGSHNVEGKHEIPEGEVLNFFCPHCHTELIGTGPCPECNVSMVPMIVRSGGVVQICPRNGCKGHLLDLG